MKRTMKTIQIGDIFPTNEGGGGTVRVVKITNNRNIDIEHTDKYGYIDRVQLAHLNDGRIKNPYTPNVFGVGFIGNGQYFPMSGGKHSDAYVKWHSMMRRCYYSDTHILHSRYSDCVVATEWHNFQNFARWYTAEPNCNKDYHLDKDILVPGNRIYSPVTCVLVPKIINSLFTIQLDIANNSPTTGVYKRGGRFRAESSRGYIGTYDTLKEARCAYLEDRNDNILSIANKYKFEIDSRVYHRIIELIRTSPDCRHN